MLALFLDIVFPPHSLNLSLLIAPQRTIGASLPYQNTYIFFKDFLSQKQQAARASKGTTKAWISALGRKGGKASS